MRVTGILLFFSLISGVFATESAKEGDIVVQSWQVEHPFGTGFLSGMAFGLWPSSFGADRIEAGGAFSMNNGYGQDAFVYVAAANQPIFKSARWFGMALSVLLLAALAISRLRKPGQP